MRTGEVTAVIGGQYGSEGKGVIVKHIANDYGVHVRVGGPNAGHTIFHEGKLWKMRAIPCGWVNPKATLLIGRGAIVDLDVLSDEIDNLELAGYSILDRLTIDARAAVIQPVHKSGPGARDRIERYASCGTGTGQVRLARLARNPKLGGFTTVGDLAPNGFKTGGNVQTIEVHDLVERGASVLLEGTQGHGLGLTYGPWPFVSNHDATAAQLLNDVGLAPTLLSHVIVVVRRYPIRVGGNSGPLRGEFSWDELSEKLGYSVEERTSVTGRIRRIGEWDMGDVREAVRVNRADELAVMCMDYEHPDNLGVTSFYDLAEQSQRFIEEVEAAMPDYCTLRFIGTGRKAETDDFAIIDYSYS